MADSLSILEENSHPIISISPCTLAELASINIAFFSWLKRFRQGGVIFTKSVKQSPFRCKLQANNLEYAPRLVKATLDSYIDVVMMKITTPSLKIIHEHIIKRFHLLVFAGNGVIHWKDTIANFLADDSLSNLVKFRLACISCVEANIDLLWPLVRKSNELNIDNLQFESVDVLLYYWICRKTGQLSRIPLQGYSRIELLMLARCSKNRYYSGIEYFVSLWDTDYRFAEIDEFSIHLARSSEVYSDILPHLDGTLQRYILDQRGAEILNTFLINNSFEYAVQTWLYVRNSFTAERFFTEVVKRFISRLEENKNNFHVGYKSIIERGFVQIWLNSPQEWRDYTVKYHFLDVLNELHLNGVNVFLFAFLSELDVKTRNQLWLDNWSKWMKTIPPAQFFKSATLYLMKTELIDNFKMTFSNSQEFSNYTVNELMSQGNYDELDAFVNCMYSDPAQTLTVKQNILEIGIRLFISRGQFDQLEKLMRHIEKTFPNKTLADDFKAKVLFDDRTQKLLGDQIVRGDGKTIQVVLNSFKSLSRHRKMRRILLRIVSDRITNGIISSARVRFLWRTFINEESAYIQHGENNYIPPEILAVIFLGMLLIPAAIIGIMCYYLNMFS